MVIVHDRLDLQFVSGCIARHAARPTTLDTWRLQRVGRYLQRYKRLIMVFELVEIPSNVVVWSDADWAGDQQTRKSTSGGIVVFGGCPLRTYSRSQPSLALSTAEAEY